LTDSAVQFNKPGYAIFLAHKHVEKIIMGILHCILFNKVSETEKGLHCLRDSDVQLYKSAYEIFPINHNFEKNKTNTLHQDV
jgi:hypothetical protein